MQIEVAIQNKIASLKDKLAYGVCGNSDYLIKFDFDSEWDAYNTKTARFKYGSSYTDVVFTGTECNMPLIENVHSVEIGVFAGSLHTTTSAYLPMKKSILSDSGTPVVPTPSVYEQILAMLNGFSANVVKSGSKATITIVDPEGTTTAEVKDGNCNFAHFNLSPITGRLIATYTLDSESLIFTINNNGHMEVSIQ